MMRGPDAPQDVGILVAILTSATGAPLLGIQVGTARAAIGAQEARQIAEALVNGASYLDTGGVLLSMPSDRPAALAHGDFDFAAELARRRTLAAR